MLPNKAVLLALRNRLLTTVAASTGLTTLAATSSGFTRATGSFVTDRFVAGMEVVPVGFTDNTPAIITNVTTLVLTIRGSRPVQAAGSNRSLTVGIPALRGWENKRVDPIDGRWIIEEDYLPGVSFKASVGSLGELEHLPAYVVKLGGIANDGISAMFDVADAIVANFPPSFSVAQINGRSLTVRGEPAPSRTQLIPDAEDAGRVNIVITIPLYMRTQNTV